MNKQVNAAAVGLLILVVTIIFIAVGFNMVAFLFNVNSMWAQFAALILLVAIVWCTARIGIKGGKLVRSLLD